jgi:hypothetical protein
MVVSFRLPPERAVGTIGADAAVASPMTCQICLRVVHYLLFVLWTRFNKSCSTKGKARKGEINLSSQRKFIISSVHQSTSGRNLGTLSVTNGFLCTNNIRHHIHIFCCASQEDRALTSSPRSPITDLNSTLDHGSHIILPARISALS